MRQQHSVWPAAVAQVLVDVDNWLSGPGVVRLREHAARDRESGGDNEFPPGE